MMEGSGIRKRVALVTGASRGLGAAIAERLADNGFAVAVNYSRNRGQADEVVARIMDGGGVAAAFRADVTDWDEVKGMVGRIREVYGTPDVLVNNATGPQPLRSLEEQRWEDYRAQLDFFLKAPFLLLQELLPEMKARKFGRIINIGSEVVELGNPRFSHYVAAKAAMLGATRAWASELGPFGIQVNLVEPGWIPVERHAGTAHAELEAYRIGVPLARMGTPRELADAVVFLAGEGASFITGQRLAVNGGNTF